MSDQHRDHGGDRGSTASVARQTQPRLEVVSRLPMSPRRVPPILFVHGAWHGAWCWEEHFVGHFASRGFETYALSLRGHGLSEGSERLRFTRLREYVDDVARVAAELSAPPVLVGHSLGGYVVQAYLQNHVVPAAVLMASLPPTGSGSLLLRMTRLQPLDVLKANLTLSLWPLIRDVTRAQRGLFSIDMPREEVARHHARMQDESIFSTLDSLSPFNIDPKRSRTPMLVLGGGSDIMIPAHEVAATARAYGVEPVQFPGVAHDMMLDPNWRAVADTIIADLDRRFVAGAGAAVPGRVASYAGKRATTG